MLNNIKSKYILNLVVGKLKKRIELKLVKYNKILINKLNIKKEDFENFKLLKEMNQKFNLDIKDIDIKELNLRNRDSGNEILDYLKRIEFKELKELDLSGNKISDINILEKVYFKELKILDLRYNKITDINILEKVNFKELKALY